MITKSSPSEVSLETALREFGFHGEIPRSGDVESVSFKTDQYLLSVCSTKTGYELFALSLQEINAEVLFELQMKDIELNSMNYQLSTLQSLLATLSTMEMDVDLSFKFQEFVCTHFLFSASWFLQRSRDADGNLFLHSLYPSQCPVQPLNAENRTQATNTMRIIDGLLSEKSGQLEPEQTAEMLKLIRQSSSSEVKDIVCLPVSFDNASHGFFVFFTNPRHYGLKKSDLMLLKNATNLITPLYRNLYLMELSMKDELSGLGNRRMFNKALQRETTYSIETGGPLSLIMLDIDHFKKINDTYGHSVGDRTIAHLSGIIKNSCRQLDLSFRYGGEEFAILLRATEEQAHIVAERIMGAIQNSTLPLESASSLKYTVSIGIAEFTADQNKNSFINSADQALYQAKETGRNRIILAVSHKASA